MKNLKLIGLSVIGGLLVGTAGVYYYNKKQMPVEIPNLSPRSSDATASVEFLNAQQSVEFYRDAIRRKPEVTKNYVELAQMYIQEARVTANHHVYYPKAEYLLNEALNRDPNDFNAIITKASLLLTYHKFSEAKQLAEKAISMNSYNAFSYGVLCDALVELGEYGEAVKVCDKMLSIRPDLRSYARAAYLRELYGDNVGAKLAMQMAGDAGVAGQENRAWAFYNLGKLYLNEGKLDTAEYIFNGILKERPQYGYAISGLAQVRCAQGDFKKAIELLSKASETTPDHVFLEQLADIYKATGDALSAEGTAKIVLKSFEQHEKAGWNVDKEYALFCANHDINLDEALSHAQREFERRPKNIDALDAYAWALYKNGKANDAVPFIEQALKLNTKSSQLVYHAGMIYEAAGQTQKAVAKLQEALNINPYINVLYVESARKALQKMNAVASIQ